MHRSRRHAPLICHCEEANGRRGNLGKAVTFSPGLSCDPAGSCEIATAPSGPRNDKPLAFTVLTKACTGCKCSAGRGMPLPYNGVCGRRWCPEICSCQWRSLTAATDAIGLYVLSAAGTDCKCLPEIAPQGHFLALRAQGATSACGLLAMTNLEALRHKINTTKIASLHGAHRVPLPANLIVFPLHSVNV